MSSNMYREALAEAKKLREVAEQNAKNAIVEAVTPKIREFIDNQLINEGQHTSTQDERSSINDIIAESIGLSSEENVELDETALESLAGLIGSKSSSGDILNALAESINSLDKSQADLVMSAAKKISSADKNLNTGEINKDVSDLQENTQMASREKVYEIDLSLLREEVEKEKHEGGAKKGDQSKSRLDYMKEDDVDADDASATDESLQEILRSLGLLNEDKLEIDLGDDVELPEDIMITARLLVDDEEGDEDLEVEDETMDIEDEFGDEELDVEEESLDEVFEVDPHVLREELTRIRRIVREAKSLADAKGGANPMEASWGGKGNAKAGQKNQFGGSGSGKGNPFGGGSEKGDVYKVKINALAESLKKEQRRNVALKERLDEYRGAVETLREQLTDLNLFNAKLLYVNKLFQDKSVTSSRRRSMVESIDAAKSLREVKLIYKTLTGSQGRSRNLSESTKRTLGSSSRSVGRSSATAASNEIDRWAILAGIKN